MHYVSQIAIAPITYVGGRSSQKIKKSIKKNFKINYHLGPVPYHILWLKWEKKKKGTFVYAAIIDK